MKYIEKKKQNEPSTLKQYRKTPNASYGGFGDSSQMLKKALLKEQGHICAYCNRRISLKTNAETKPQIEVEHYLPQKEYPKKGLDYLNMIGVCNGITIERNEHCDKSKKETLLKKLNPLKPDAESLVTYTLSGKIIAVADNKDVKNDIDLLNLNDSFLEKSRKQAMDEVLQILKQKYPERDWTKYLFEKEIETWSNKHKGKFRPYCQAAIWFLELLKKRNRYPAK